jgi:hypothetical protein
MLAKGQHDFQTHKIQAVQSRQLRKLQLASGGFGFVKDDHSSNKVQEIMVSLETVLYRYL